jgi:hypothetical protein
MPHTAEDPVVVRPMDRHSQIEVDVFCANCFYNLHGQIVTIDPQLNIPICKCPECGRYHPAGTSTTSSSVWMRRLASILLLMWVWFIGAATFAFSGIFFAFAVSSIEAYRLNQSIPISTNKWHYRAVLYPWQAPGNPDENINGITTMLWLCAGSLVTGFVVGMLCVTLLWHWPRQRYLATALLPLIPAGLLAMIYHSMPECFDIYNQCIARILSQTAIQTTGILLGILTGRTVSRTIISMIIPPKPRQSLAFLWMVDGKKLPLNSE